MELSNYDFPEVDKTDVAFPTLNTTSELVNEARSRDLTKGRSKFNELFFNGGEVKLKDNVKGTWREDAYRYARYLMGSYAPKHEDKEDVCAMIFQETITI